MAAEIFGREGGLGRGRGGHMHLFDPDVHFSCSGIIAEGCRPRSGRRSRSRAARATGWRSRSPVRAPRTRARSTSRSTWPRCGSCRWCSWSRTTTGRSRCRATPPPASRPTPTGPPPTAYRASGSTTTTWKPSTRRPVTRSPGRAPGRGRRCSRSTPLRLWGHFEGDPQAYRPELADVPARDPIPAYEQRLTRGRHPGRGRGTGRQGRGIGQGREGDRVREVQPGSRAGDGA